MRFKKLRLKAAAMLNRTTFFTERAIAGPVIAFIWQEIPRESFGIEIEFVLKSVVPPIPALIPAIKPASSMLLILKKCQDSTLKSNKSESALTAISFFI